MKTKPKPRRMWANYYARGDVLLHTSRKSAQSWALHEVTMAGVPVAVIPLGNADELVDVAGHAFSAAHDGHLCKSDIVAMLTAIGVLPKQRKGGRK